jgi:hypothetical protein
MKRFIFLLFAVFPIIGLQAQDNQVLMIDKGWKFISGDHPEVFSPEYDDAFYEIHRGKQNLGRTRL